jgi:hypothetical protein
VERAAIGRFVRHARFRQIGVDRLTRTAEATLTAC